MKQNLKKSTGLFFLLLAFSACSIQVGSDVTLEIFNGETGAFEPASVCTDSDPEVEGKLGLNRDQLDPVTSPYFLKSEDGQTFMKYRLTNHLEAPVRVEVLGHKEQVVFHGNQLIQPGKQLEFTDHIGTSMGWASPYTLRLELSGGGLAIFENNADQFRFVLNIDQDLLASFNSLGLDGQVVEMHQGEMLRFQDHFPGLSLNHVQSSSPESVEIQTVSDHNTFLRARAFGTSEITHGGPDFSFTVKVKPFVIELNEGPSNYVYLDTSEKSNLRFSVTANADYLVRVTDARNSDMYDLNSLVEINKTGTGTLKSINATDSGDIYFTAQEDGLLFLDIADENGNSGSAQLELVTLQPVESISVDQQEISLVSGNELKLNVSVAPDLPYQLNWSTSDVGICRVDSHGLVKALAPGTATVRVYPGGDVAKAVDISVTVSPASAGVNGRTFGVFNIGEKLVYTAPVSASSSYDLLFEDESSSILSCSGTVQYKVTHSVDGLLADAKSADAFLPLALAGIVSDGTLTVEVTAITGDPAWFNFTLRKDVK